MGVWNHLRREAERQKRQERACQKVEKLGELIMQEAHEIGELHRQQRAKKEAIDLNDTKTKWALSCDAVGDDSYWED